jgi:GMP synthase (glutamine-hydrolysing)
MRTTSPLLLVEHEAMCPPGWVGEWLTDAGCTLDVRRPYAGDELPEDLARHGGMVVLGGSMDACSDARHPWLTQVKHLVRLAAEEHVPVLGICLGHQVAAVALGGAVEVNPRGQQIGVLDFGWSPDAAGDPLLGAVTSARAGVQWNNDIVSVPPTGTEVLARTPHGEIQAARFAPTVWGVQSHPEAGEEIVAGWAENDRDSAAERGVDVDEYLATVARARDELRTTWQPLAARFAALCRQRVPAW